MQLRSSRSLVANSFLVGALATVAFAMPAVGAESLSYRYVDITLFPEAEFDNGSNDVDGEGAQLRGSLPVHENFFVLTEFQILNLDDDVDTTRLIIGGGGHWPINGKLDIIARAGIVYFEVDAGRSEDDTGLFLGARLRALIAPRIEVEGGFDYQRVEVGELENDAYLVAEARYNFTPELSAGVLLNVGGDTSVFGVQARYSF